MNGSDYMKINNKKKIILIAIIAIALVVVLITVLNKNSNKNTAAINGEHGKSRIVNYDGIKEILDNQVSAVIYVYDSKDETHKELKQYIDEQDINYYVYDNAKVSNEEYSNFLKLFDFDSDVFGMPAMIFTEDGKMYGNIININGKDVIRSFINDYHLYTLK